MSQASTRYFKMGQAGSRSPRFDKRIIVPIAVVAYSSIVSPFLIYLNAASPIGSSPVIRMPESHPENMIFWPAVTAISIVLAVRNSSRLALPPHIICLAAYLAFAGLTVFWAFNPTLSFTRFSVEVMMVTSIILPAMLADRTTDLMRGLFLTFAAGSALNFIIVLNERPVVYEGVFYYQGYFTDKNTLGECASVAFLLALHEMFHSGLRRALGIVIVIISAWLVFVSNSKTSFGLAVLSPLLATPLVLIRRKRRISPAVVLSPVPYFFVVLSNLNMFNRISYMLYGNYTFSARTVIWDFVRQEIDRRPLLGWGYQSFWQVGLDGPSIVDAGGWIRGMPHAHNGYLDAKLETGYVGFAFLLIFIFATLHAAGRLIDRDPVRAWLVLSLALYEIVTNCFESTWLRGSDPVWVAFVIVVAEIGRYWHPLPPRGRSQYLAGRAVASNAANAGLYRRKGTEMVRSRLHRITSQTGDS